MKALNVEHEYRISYVYFGGIILHAINALLRAKIFAYSGNIKDK